jgi:hypothetical protein
MNSAYDGRDGKEETLSALPGSTITTLPKAAPHGRVHVQKMVSFNVMAFPYAVRRQPYAKLRSSSLNAAARAEKKRERPFDRSLISN